jgi:CRISPR/Cas system-associated endonuclease Cas1
LSVYSRALINYVYALGEFGCSVALRAQGLDPDIGWLHRDTPYRASAALDVEEAIRPVADAFVLDPLRSRTFSRREFGELTSGQVRLSSSLAKPLAEVALPMLEGAAQPTVAEVVAILDQSDRSTCGLGHGDQQSRRAPYSSARCLSRSGVGSTRRAASAA